MIIWLASFPRSGNTYFAKLLKDCFGNQVYSIYNEKNEPLILNHINAIIDESGKPLSLKQIKKSKKIFFIKTHDLPQDDSPAIYLVRDGRDSLVSYTHHIINYGLLGTAENEKTEFADLLHDLIVYNHSFGGWGQNVKAWINRSAPTEVIKFELLVKHHRPELLIQETVKKLGYELNLLPNYTFPTFEVLHKRNPDFFRKGKIGAWQTEMPKDLENLFWILHGDAMRAAGYDQLNSLLLIEQLKELKDQVVSSPEKISQFQSNVFSAETINLQQLSIQQQEIIRLLQFIQPIANMVDYFRPKLGALYQHKPRPLIFPNKYQTAPLPKLNKIPKITIVTPSYQQGDYIERTIQSVLEQGYLDLEYIVQDGGSTDQTIEAVKKYQDKITRFESYQDKGQAHAINLGFQNTSGEIMAYLNSDDMLTPGALNYIANYFAMHPTVDVVYGHRIVINEKDKEVGRWILPPHDKNVLLWADYIPQETLFWRRKLWEKTGGAMDETFRFALDWELLIRFQEAGAVIKRLPRFLGMFRVHEKQKTSDQMSEIGVMEMARIRRHTLRKDVSEEDIIKHIKGYLRKSVVYHKLYRLGVLKY